MLRSTEFIDRFSATFDKNLCWVQSAFDYLKRYQLPIFIKLFVFSALITVFSVDEGVKNLSIH